MKIGFIDYYLDEWHANNYPQWIGAASGGAMTVAYAYGKIPAPSGMTSEEWCAKNGVQHCDSIEEVIEKSDRLIVLSPDNAEMHWELCQLPLRSGKPTYVDKTFAVSEKEAQALMNLAEENGTPMFSSSALRFSDELKVIERENIKSVTSIGPGQMETYLIHQVEPVVSLYAEHAQAIQYVGNDTTPMLILDFGGGKRASITMLGFKSPSPFMTCVQYADETVKLIGNANNYFDNFIAELVRFFETTAAPVEPWQTIEVMRILEKAKEAKESPDKWIDLAKG